MSDVMLNSMLKVKNGVGEEWLQGYGLLTFATVWLTGSCGCPVQHHERGLCRQPLAQERPTCKT